MAVLVTRPDVRGAQLTEMLIQAGILQSIYRSLRSKQDEN